MKERLSVLWRQDGGQDLVEYALVAALIAVVCVAGMTLVGQKISNIWSAITSSLGTANVS